jgi:solute carrier family 25 phosphate transporter 3
MLCPMEAVRIRMVAEPSFAPQGWIQCGLKMLKYEGVEGLWKGMTPMVYKQVPYTVTKNVSFDFLTRSTYAAMRQNGVVMSSAVKVSVPMFAAFVASLLSCVSSQPGDMLLSLVNAHKGKRRTKDIVRDILRTDRGIKGFFVGIKTRLLHVGIIVTLQLLIYDFVKRLCGIAATGL